MAPIHAYYLPGDSASATDASHPVGVEHLDALGWKIMFMGGSGDELEKAAQNQAQELGYPVTNEACAVGMIALLRRLPHSVTAGDDMCTTKDALAVITGGSLYLHVEDVTAKAWIHLDVVPGMLFRFPAGAKFRLTLDDESNRKVKATAFFKVSLLSM
ncbi:hypothetical protein BDP27DRAFT_1426512 [Rhodocollybia butyracea]|uniref:Uncharacterized protein n=1 Tax=Rhodocollybia butyracea TaxID=206335 RepID=A0A9P5U2V2_9AGAR|nr:hypothetical protein BDP27DRAFT_1426512 [Rhodocollybia butyracea]